MTNNSTSRSQLDGLDILRQLYLLRGIALNYGSVNANINAHVATSFFEMRSFDYAKLDIVDDFSNDTCYYNGSLERNFASAFLYNETKNLGLGINWVARSSAKDYEMPWGGKNLLAGDREKFRISLFASDGTPGSENKPYSFEGENKYIPSGKLCCSELPLLNALDCIANGLDLISGPEDSRNDSCFVMITERITCNSCRENIVKFLRNNYIKKLRLYYMFDSVHGEQYEDISSLLYYFHGNDIDAVIVRVKFIHGVDKDLYANTLHRVETGGDFNPFNGPDTHVYVSMDIRSMSGKQVMISHDQHKFDPTKSSAYCLDIDPSQDILSQALDFFENEFFENHKYNLFNMPERRQK